jgi:hypothetical protein
MQALVRAGQDVNFRDSYAPLPSCRVSRFLAASFARNRRFGDFLEFGTFDGCASGVRDGEYARVLSEYSLPLTVTQNDNIVDPWGERAVLCSGTGWVLGYPRGAHPRTPGPPCTVLAAPRWTGRRFTAIAESSDRSSDSAPT